MNVIIRSYFMFGDDDTAQFDGSYLCIGIEMICMQQMKIFEQSKSFSVAFSDHLFELFNIKENNHIVSINTQQNSTASHSNNKDITNKHTAINHTIQYIIYLQLPFTHFKENSSHAFGCSPAAYLLPVSIPI
ncbi:CLUMA_CG011804, isoform A [Clunio marinus]|uniref:CLUMA_CG011804, isoform A n=1 Tax=Clunio marinus TaxID=568069 RepID=A0A1J1IDV2_9DIPT|nr:CLUMA_CG011804, isoform A [Clunio marinus]